MRMITIMVMRVRRRNAALLYDGIMKSYISLKYRVVRNARIGRLFCQDVFDIHYLLDNAIFNFTLLFNDLR